jgi:hypothetical protein
MREAAASADLARGRDAGADEADPQEDAPDVR